MIASMIFHCAQSPQIPDSEGWQRQLERCLVVLKLFLQWLPTRQATPRTISLQVGLNPLFLCLDFSLSFLVTSLGNWTPRPHSPFRLFHQASTPNSRSLRLSSSIMALIDSGDNIVQFLDANYARYCTLPFNLPTFLAFLISLSTNLVWQPMY